MFTKESNYNPRFWGKKSTPLWGIFNNYKEKLSVPKVQTAAFSLKQQHHNASIQLRRLRQVLFDVRAENSNLAKCPVEKSNHAMYQDENLHRGLLSSQKYHN